MKKQFVINKEAEYTTITTFSAAIVSSNWKYEKDGSLTEPDRDLSEEYFQTFEEAKSVFDKIDLPANRIEDDGSVTGAPNDEYKELIKYEIVLSNDDTSGCTEYELTKSVYYELLGNPTDIL